MIKRQSEEWDHFLSEKLDELLSQRRVEFKGMTPRALPQAAGVYLITKIEGDIEIPY